MAKENQTLNDPSKQLSMQFIVTVMVLGIQAVGIIVAVEGFDKPLTGTTISVLLALNLAIAGAYFMNNYTAIKTSGIETKHTLHDDDAKFKSALAMQGFMSALDAQGNSVLVHQDKPNEPIPMVIDSKSTAASNVSHLPSSKARLSDYGQYDKTAANG